MLNKILVVDDSSVIQSYYRTILRRYKECNLIQARNGAEALDRLDAEKNVDLILLDINMPIMSGIEFLEMLNQNGVHNHIPVIIISTEGSEEDTERGIALGAKGYITKPFQAGQLHALIEEIFSAS